MFELEVRSGDTDEEAVDVDDPPDPPPPEPAPNDGNDDDDASDGGDDVSTFIDDGDDEEDINDPPPAGGKQHGLSTSLSISDGTDGEAVDVDDPSEQPPPEPVAELEEYRSGANSNDVAKVYQPSSFVSSINELSLDRFISG